MSLLWYDGFEQYGNGEDAFVTEGLWISNFLHVSNLHARTGTLALSSNPVSGGSARRSLGGDHTTVGVGCGFWFDNAPTTIDAFFSGGVSRTCVIEILDKNLVTQVFLTVGTTGRLQVILGGSVEVLLGESVLEIVAGTWNHIEMKVILAGSSGGTVLVYVNGDEWLSLTGITTIATGATNYGSQVRFGVPGGAGVFTVGFLLWDDIFVYNQDTSGVHDILGEYGVYQLLPNADDGTHHDWSLTVGSSGFALIDEVPPDDDTNYIFANTSGKRSDFATTTLPANITAVAAVMPLGRLRKTDTGACSVELGVVSGGTGYYSSSFPLTTSWTYFDPIVFEKDPATSSAWNPAAMPKLSVDRTA